MKALSHLEETLALQVRAWGLPAPEREYKAIPGRQYRLDFAWPEWRLGVECEGGTWQKGGHSTGTGIQRDIDKANLLTLEGWRLLRFTWKHIQDGSAVEMIQRALGSSPLAKAGEAEAREAA